MGEAIETICWVLTIVWIIYVLSDERKNKQ
nr:MAG TPA: hypothetical protein [Caudoviricetes sp.]